MPALFWLIVLGLAAAVGAAAAAPWLRERSGTPPRGPGPPGDLGSAPPSATRPATSRPPWVVPVAIAAGGLLASLIVVWVIPGFPVFVFFLPLIWWQRRNRRPPGPPGGGRPF